MPRIMWSSNLGIIQCQFKRFRVNLISHIDHSQFKKFNSTQFPIEMTIGYRAMIELNF